MEAVPAVAFLLGSMTIPESPRYLVFVGKHERARKVFRRIGGDADRLVRQVEQTLEAERRSQDVGSYYSRHETYRSGALGGNGFGCFPAIRWYQHYFLFR